MNGKSLNRNRIRLLQAATGITPADYPLGSLESRAAARALLDEGERLKPPISDYDWDAAMIYSGTYWLTARMSPDPWDLEATDIWRRGRELSDEQDEAGKVGRDARVAEILEPLVGFEIPAPLDYRNLTPEQDRAIRGASLAILIPAVEQAWHRRLKDLPFPVRVDGTRFLYRTRNGEWEEDTINTAALEEFAKRQQEETKHETV